MEAWLDRLATTLGEEPPSAAETSEILTVARDVAHRVERKITPVSTYLVGIAVGRRLAGGSDGPEALRAAIGALRSVLPEEPAAEPDRA
jgi:Domain of unknown function (DUF6457)